MSAIRVILADDHPVVRAGLRKELEAAGIQVLAEAEQGQETLDLVGRLHPDVLILDVEMPGLTGLDIVRKLRERGQSPYILVVSAYDHEVYVYGMLDAGAVGYVLKEEALDVLVKAVQTAARGDVWLSPRVASKILPRLRRSPDIRIGLTERELEVLQLVVKGNKDREIAKRLGISERTVRLHLRFIYDKLGVNGRTEAAVHAVQRGLVR